MSPIVFQWVYDALGCRKKVMQLHPTWFWERSSKMAPEGRALDPLLVPSRHKQVGGFAGGHIYQLSHKSGS